MCCVCVLKCRRDAGESKGVVLCGPATVCPDGWSALLAVLQERRGRRRTWCMWMPRES